MQLTNYTDYSLRALIALGTSGQQQLTVAQISAAYSISTNHLLKVIQRLSTLGYVETSRGKGGGVRLAREPQSLRLGQLVLSIEPELGLVGCMRSDDAKCVIEPACRLKGILAAAFQQFIAELDRYTLADLLVAKPKLQRLLVLGPRAGSVA
jgi:Rrf2 family transcriptional regulator, nitric oxide-sensitive transcriptional repressor